MPQERVAAYMFEQREEHRSPIFLILIHGSHSSTSVLKGSITKS